MLKKTSIPSTKSDQTRVLLQGIVLFVIVTTISFIGFKSISFFSYPHPFSRVPKYDGGIFFIPFFFLSIWYSGKYLLNNNIYHLELHSDILIITSKAVFNKRRDFFYLEKITTVSIQKERRYLGENSSLIDYEVTTLNIESTNQAPMKYSFFPNYYDLKALKKLLKDFI